MQALPIRCNDPGCNKPWLHIYNGLIFVESRHHGHHHVNSCTFDLLVELLRATLGHTSEAQMRAILPEEWEPAPVMLETGETVWAAPLRCYRPQCRLPWAYVYDGILSVDSYHDGEKHQNRISMQMLNRMLGGQVNARLWRGYRLRLIQVEGKR